MLHFFIMSRDREDRRRDDGGRGDRGGRYERGRGEGRGQMRQDRLDRLERLEKAGDRGLGDMFKAGKDSPEKRLYI